MAITKQQFARYIRDYNFRELFNDLGWNNDKATQPIIVDDQTYMLRSVAVKSGFKILVCDPDKDGLIPDYNIRKKIETKVTKLFQEHLIVFTDAKRKEQLWQLVMRQTGKPSKLTDTRYFTHQDPELLFQKASGLLFELNEEENITIVDVTQRVTENFHQNAERVTKDFYRGFQREHKSFYAFIKGIDDHIDEWNKKRKKGEAEQENKAKQWYVSLMLNRLMFCYFIQKKGFLNKNKNYLRDKLNECKSKKGKNKFYSFYRDFLLVLFHDGLNEPEKKKSIQDEIGIIPYLNGGLFDEHELETSFKIEIDDKAFESIFDFFDEWDWHLDTREHSSGKEINPDVIGCIFEKYINERAKMGAYYTKEDITDYISKNCIIPWLFDEVARQYPKAFAANSEIWSALKDSGDTYIYPAVKHGADIELSKNVASGIKDVAKRTDWNKPAHSDVALPTEIWREVIERRKRYKEIAQKIKDGAITNINDFITYNLNIREFAQDVVANTEDPEFLKAFYKALSKVTIIDPTCGSGAFLFAAMNILEPLYYTCITRMRGFTEDEDRENEQQQKKFSNKYKFFRDILQNVQSDLHPNTQYFIYKSIILNNLYGVDIMKEAVEIAKLRLFLKLVATVDADYRKPNLGLEPLPDIDFNIRPGNTLIGFATEADLDKALTYTLDGQMAKPEITEKMEIVAMAYKNFKNSQVTTKDFRTVKKDKNELYKRLKELNKECNKLLHKQASGIKYDQWLNTYQPFHWFAEFYEIIHSRNGFDIVIGNPPYLEQRQIDYEAKHLKTFPTNAVHNMCIERSLQIINDNGNISMIVPLAIVCTQRMVIVQNLLEEKRAVWYSNFAWRPGRLFDDVNRALSIFVANKNNSKTVYSTSYNKWSSEVREFLFPLLRFIQYSCKRSSFWVPKLGSTIETKILEKLLKANCSISKILTSSSSYKVYYRTTGGLYWKVFTNFPPKFFVNGKEGKSSRETFFCTASKNYDVISVALLSSDIFWWWYTITSNLRDLNPSDIQGFKFPSSVLDDAAMIELGKSYLKDITKRSVMSTRIQKQTGETQTQSFRISLSKNIIEQIDEALAEHYGFTDEEIDFIKNYDYKFRMSTVEEEEE